MESTSPPPVGIGAQRSNNTTPHHHYYTPEQPSSFISHGGYGDASRRGSNLHYKGHHPPSSRATPRSRGQSPSVNSLGGESAILMDASLSPHIIGHGHNHLHDDSHIHINCDSSHSISPPNSNSNTTISCGSGNSTSANIGMPTNHNSRTRNGRNINNNRKSKEHLVASEEYENFRNKTDKVTKSILEDDEKEEREDYCLGNFVSHPKFKQRPPFINPNQEFLPICDALFNMISLAAYFCDVVFDVLTVYSWYKISVQSEPGIFDVASISSRNSGEVDEVGSLIPPELMWQWSVVGLFFITLSAILSQTLSFKWYKQSEQRGQKAPDGSNLEGAPPPCSSGILVLMHVSLVGVLWRYFKLFIPVDLRFVKNEVRDLCLLRLIHAFCQAAPMLLLQLYLIWHEPNFDAVSDLTKVSTALSLFSVCWALASFSKNIRRQNVHKLVLTWLGVIFQFFWRLGTVSSRFLALSLYALVYQYWVFVVLFLHWFCMLLWLISPKNIFHGEKMSPLRKVSYSAIVAVVYTFCYINVQETNSRIKVVIYYVTMFLENSLLFGVWLIAVRYEDEIWFRSTVTWAVYTCFAGGLTFMLFYYKYFHVKKLAYVYDAESSIYRNTSSIGGCSLANHSVATISGGDCDRKNGVIIGYRGNNGSLIVSNGGVLLNGGNSAKKLRPSNPKLNGRRVPTKTHEGKDEGPLPRAGPLYNKIGGHASVPGVFNCRFHPAMKRKKKKPTTFVPPPAVPTPPAPVGPPTPPHVSNDLSPISNGTHELRLGENIMSPAHESNIHGDSVSSNIAHHHHHLEYDNSANSSNHLANTSMAAHYDLPEGSMCFDPNGRGDGSASSSYGPISGLYPVPKGSGRMMAPFWRRPLSLTMGSENEGSVSSRVDIQQKLQEKKQQQLAELREIEEEIKQGKLKRPELHEIIPQPVNSRQPIPVEKKQPWFGRHAAGEGPPIDLSQRAPILLPVGDHEILLDPQYLMYATPSVPMGIPPYVDNGSGFYYNPDWPVNYYEPLYQNDMGDSGGGTSPPSQGASGGDASSRIDRRRRNGKKGHFDPSSRESIYKSYRIHSDMDSQMSLPRSYTLPREFKYKRKFRKPVKTENFLPSTNSSDGDVDSGGDETYSQVRPYPLPLPSMHHIPAPVALPTATPTSVVNSQPNSAQALRQSRKAPNSRSRHKLHETKL